MQNGHGLWLYFADLWLNHNILFHANTSVKPEAAIMDATSRGMVSEWVAFIGNLERNWKRGTRDADQSQLLCLAVPGTQSARLMASLNRATGYPARAYVITQPISKLLCFDENLFRISLAVSLSTPINIQIDTDYLGCGLIRNQVSRLAW